MSLILHTVVIGVLATALMDVWGIAREPLFGFPRANYRLIGRWFAYMLRGRFWHASVAEAAPRRGELLIGWVMHYTIGVGFAALLVQLVGSSWLAQPTPGPALLVGLATLAAPLLIMQPAMGAGIAASRTRHPWSARLQSAITHVIYGLGLYLAAWILAHLTALSR